MPPQYELHGSLKVSVVVQAELGWVSPLKVATIVKVYVPAGGVPGVLLRILTFPKIESKR